MTPEGKATVVCFERRIFNYPNITSLPKVARHAARMKAIWREFGDRVTYNVIRTTHKIKTLVSWSV